MTDNLSEAMVAAGADAIFAYFHLAYGFLHMRLAHHA